MKKINRYLVMAVAAILSAACTEDAMNTEPLGDFVTSEQKSEVANADPEKTEAAVNAISASMTTLGAAWHSGSNHNDFGYPAVMLVTEHSGEDLVSSYHGYNWFNPALRFIDRTPQSDHAELIWLTLYNQISAANAVIGISDPETEDSNSQFYLGQALTARALSYMTLAQIFQFTYKGHENDLCVPYISENTESTARRTVAEIYGHIMDDLNLAVDLLSKTSRTRADKRYADVSVAYGLRARANLIMNNWAEAASDADAAMKGYTPYSIDEVSKPTFNAVTNAWMWAIVLAETDDVVQHGLATWASHICSFTMGYTGLVACYRSINKKLYDEIPSTDVRKGWWLDENTSSPNIANYGGLNINVTGPTAFGCSAGGDDANQFGGAWAPYVNVKFGPWKDELGSSTPANPWPLMRVEEMYFIKAEALAMSGNTGEAKSLLESFVKTYRDPSYTCSASSAEDIRDAVWFQRRIELWGEGFSFFDVLRLKKPIDRRGGGFNKAVVYNIPEESGIMLWLIPQSEVEANKELGPNNMVYSAPSSVADL